MRDRGIEPITGIDFLESLPTNDGNWRDGPVKITRPKETKTEPGNAIDDIKKRLEKRSLTPILDAVKKGKNIFDVPEVKALEGQPENSQLSGLQDFIARFGAWFLAGLFIILGIWRLITSGK